MADNTEAVAPLGTPEGGATTATQGSTTPSQAPTAEFEEITDPHMARVSSMAELQQKSPSTYNATLESLALTVIRDCRRHQEAIKRALKNRQ